MKYIYIVMECVLNLNVRLNERNEISLLLLVFLSIETTSEKFVIRHKKFDTLIIILDK